MSSESNSVYLSVTNCPICEDSLHNVESGQNCVGCGSRARLRSMIPIVDKYIRVHVAGALESELPLLGFAMTGAERKVLARVFKKFKSASLFGSYASDHESGVDMRDLSRYASNSFSGVFGCLLFDYFAEHEVALEQCFNVIAPGGIFLTHIAPYRLMDGNSEPELKGSIKSRAGYFEYLPEKTELADVKVGRDWFIAAMKRVGFEVALLKVQDAVPGLISEWFVGIKPGKLVSTQSLTVNGKTKAAAMKSRISTAFQSIIPFGDSSLASLKFELIETNSASIVFLEDHLVAAPDGGVELREIVATNGSGNCLYVSRDLGNSWAPEFTDVEWDSKIRAVFSLFGGGRLVRTSSGRMYHFNSQGELVTSHDTGAWHWHGSQGIGESSSGAVMYAEYAPLKAEDGIKEVSVWRYWPALPEKGWERVLTLSASNRPPEGELRHFHVCRPNPANPKQWILAAGDIGAHCRFWISLNDGSSWKEIFLPDPLFPDIPKDSYPRVLRFTQFCVLKNGDLIWGTDDISHSGRAALIRLSLASEQPKFYFEGALGNNCIRNIASFENKLFLLLSESKHDKSSADCIVYDAVSGRITSLLLPNISRAHHPVTNSLGSSVLMGGTGFFPAMGAVLMDPTKRGIFRIRIEETHR